MGNMYYNRIKILVQPLLVHGFRAEGIPNTVKMKKSFTNWNHDGEKEAQGRRSRSCQPIREVVGAGKVLYVL
jgi:hypothetical protein